MFPTLLSAIQARKNLDPKLADVIIILFHAGPPPDTIFSEVCRRKGIILMTADIAMLGEHTAMYARLFLDKLLPEQYQRVLYIDGDVQINAVLDGLIKSDLPDECFAAAPDPMCIDAEQHDHLARKIAVYFNGLGITCTVDKPYFNSGVLLFNRKSWAKISHDALEFLSNSPELCLFQDQSALNFAGHAKMLPMSFRWNFPIFFRNCGVEANIKPAIYHFMSKPKPWNGAFPPWDRSFHQPYLELIKEFPGLLRYAKGLSNRNKLKYMVMQNYKKIMETWAWRLSARRKGILTYHKAARF